MIDASSYVERGVLVVRLNYSTERILLEREDDCGSIELKIANLLTDAGYSSWQTYAISDVLSIPSFHQNRRNRRNVTTGAKELHSLKEGGCFVDLLLTPKRSENVDEFVGEVDEVAFCDLCGESSGRVVGRSQQIWLCCRDHVGVSRHPGTDDNLHWHGVRFLSWAAIFASSMENDHFGFWNARSVISDEAHLEVTPRAFAWWDIARADVLACERDCVLLLSFILWKTQTRVNVRMVLTDISEV